MQPGASAPSFKKWGHGHMTSQAVVCAGRGGEPCAAQLSGRGCLPSQVRRYVGRKPSALRLGSSPQGVYQPL